MTNETTYREKGRAVVLAALMVLSVVAMAASFSGAVAADSHKDKDLTKNNRYWQGQTIVVQPDDVGNGDGNESFASAETYEVINNETGGLERQISVSDGDSNFSIVTDRLTTGQYDIVNSSGVLKSQFRVDVQTLDASADSSSSTLGENVTVTLNSQRSGYNVTVSSDDLSSSELQTVFDAYSGNVNTSGDTGFGYLGSDEISLSNVNSIQDLTVNFPKADFSAGNYSLQFDAADTTANGSVELELTSPASSQANFAKNTYEEEIGDMAEFTLEPTNTGDSMWVNLSESNNYYNASFKVTGYGDADEVTIGFDTFNATSEANAFKVTGDSGATITSPEDVNIDANLGGSKLLSGDLEMEAYAQNPSSHEETDAAVLLLSKRSVKSVNTWVVPSSYSTTDNIDELRGAATQTDTVASGDLVITEVQASGIYPYLTEGENLTTSAGLELNYTNTHNPRYGSAEQIQVNDLIKNGSAHIVPDAENNTFYVVSDLTNYNSGPTVDSDETWKATFEVNSDNPYIETSDDVQSASQTFDVEKRTLEFATDLNEDDQLPIANSANSKLTVNTNVAPGTELNFRLRFPTSVSTGSAVVADDGTATASWDFSNREVGTTLDTVSATGPSESISAKGIIVEGESSQTGGLEYTVTTSPSDPVVGDSVTGTVTAENPADTTTSENVVFTFDSETVYDSTVELESGASSTLVDGSTLLENASAGNYEWTLTVGGEQVDSGTVTVSEETGGNESDSGSGSGSSGSSGSSDSGSSDSGSSGSSDSGSSGSSDSGSSDSGSSGTPGFGVGVALVALLGAAMLALRRQD
ncbi:BGTF surface domain-containing protein [Natrinema sp. 74]|uniref:BGTF surface domain-containing protein n=1 Tax=Natrinema sp. 74 TaxID=3384159 RepID=UPI0038D44D2F